MSTEQNIQIVRQAYENFQRGDIQALLNMMAEDIDWRLPEIENVPFSGSKKGRDEVTGFFASLADSQESLAFEPLEFVAQNDKVVALGRYNWRVKGTGREYSGDWAHVFTIRDGRITGFHEYMDTAAAGSAYQKASAV